MIKFIYTILVALVLVQPVTARDTLRGSRSALLAQNKEADRENLRSIDTTLLATYSKQGRLVRLVNMRGIRIDPRLDTKFRWILPQTHSFLLKLRGEYREQFRGGVLQINSAVRTIQKQQELRGTNYNAAPVHGPTASSHMRGTTIDITKKNMSAAQVHWMRLRLLNYEKVGCVEATEEMFQAVFHVMVYSRCFPAHAPVHKKIKKKVAKRRGA